MNRIRKPLLATHPNVNHIRKIRSECENPNADSVRICIRICIRICVRMCFWVSLAIAIPTMINYIVALYCDQIMNHGNFRLGTETFAGGLRIGLWKLGDPADRALGKRPLLSALSKNLSGQAQLVKNDLSARTMDPWWPWVAKRCPLLWFAGKSFRFVCALARAVPIQRCNTQSTSQSTHAYIRSHVHPKAYA